MKVVRRVVLLVMLALVVPVMAHAQQPPTAPQGTPDVAEPQGEFVPAESLPQREQMPAAPLLIGAYAFALVALFTYVVSVSRRLGAVKTDLARLEGDIKRGGRG